MKSKDIFIGVALGVVASIIGNLIIYKFGLNTQTVRAVQLLEEQNEMLRMNLQQNLKYPPQVY